MEAQTGSTTLDNMIDKQVQSWVGRYCTDLATPEHDDIVLAGVSEDKTRIFVVDVGTGRLFRTPSKQDYAIREDLPRLFHADEIDDVEERGHLRDVVLCDDSDGNGHAIVDLAQLATQRIIEKQRRDGHGETSVTVGGVTISGPADKVLDMAKVLEQTL